MQLTEHPSPRPGVPASGRRPVRAIPAMAATIERRALVTYRVDAGVAAALLPPGLRPQLVDGSAVAGICLIQLGAFRPAWFRPEIGHRSRNAAHRIAVQWDTPEGARTGVYIPRRHSGSRLARVVGGRVFPGVHERASVRFDDTDEGIAVSVEAGDVRVRVAARVDDGVTFRSGLFASLDDASLFFQKDAVGWSPTRSGRLEGLRLDTRGWRVQPAETTEVQSTFFDTLPAGAAQFDHALVMRGIPARWSSVAWPGASS